jgi:hypothetical protein
VSTSDQRPNSCSRGTRRHAVARPRRRPNRS